MSAIITLIMAICFVTELKHYGKRCFIIYFVLLCTPQVDRKEMRFSSLTFDDSGMYQCIAENRHGVIYANAELRVFGESNNYHNSHGCVTFHAN